MEFSITASASCDLNLRVCVGGSGAAGSWSDPVAWPRNTSSLGYKFHVRGWWPSSSLSLSGTSLNIQPTGPGAPPMSETTVCEDGGPELASNAFAKQAADTYGTSNGNKGCYGVNLYYGFTISNSPGDGNSYPFDVSLVCRGTDSAWYGASRIHVPTSFDAKGVNPINSTGAEKICKLTVDSNGNASSFMLNPATSITVIVSVANGSGSTLPVNIRLQGLLGYTGTGGGGS